MSNHDSQINVLPQFDISKVRRLVTGFDSTGLSTIAYEDAGKNLTEVTDTIRINELWTTPTGVSVLDGGDVPYELEPGVGGTRFRLCQMDPRPASLGADAGGTPDGLHQTASIDYVLVLSGQLTLTMEDGEVRVLSPGDIVIQRATTHAWSVAGDIPCVFLAAMVDDGAAAA